MTTPVDSAAGDSSASTAAVTNSSGAKSAGHSGEVNGSTRISSIEEMRKDPELKKLLNQMMLGIATSICRKCQKSQDRIKQINRKNRQEQR